MKLFLTGATGFIGSHVLAAALGAGHQVRALCRSPQVASAALAHQGLEWQQGTLASLDSSQFEGCDAVLHLASAGVSTKQVPWSVLLEVNVAGSLRLVEQAHAAGVRRFVVAGSAHEYGRAALRYNAIPPDAPLEPVNPYGASKAAAFQLLRGFAIDRKLELFYGRIFTAYGDGQYPGNFWPSLQRAAQAGEDFPMTSGRQISDFIPVAAVAGHLLASCSRADIIPGCPLVTNVGLGRTTTLLEFAQAEWERLGATGRLIPSALPDRVDQIDRYVPDLRGLLPLSSPLS